MVIMLDYLHRNLFVYVFLSLLISTAVTAWLAKTVNNNPESKNIFQSLERNTTVDGVLIASLLIIGSTWVWATMFPINFGHRDEIALLTHNVGPTNYSGRFFPFGHQEFNYLSLRLTKGNLAPLYVLPFLELLLTIYLIDNIADLKNPFCRIALITSSFLLSLIVPYTNLIIPERNALFFLLLSIFFIRLGLNNPSIFLAAGANLSAAISLYYKEPMLCFFGAFSITLLLESYRKKVTLANIKWLQAVLFGILTSCILFIINYLFNTYYGGAPKAYYVGNSSLRLIYENLLFFLMTAPILTTLIIITLIVFLVIPSSNQDRPLLLALLAGGISYLLTIIVLGLGLNGYYISIPILVCIIALALLTKNVATLFTKWLRNRSITRQIIVSLVILGATLIYTTALALPKIAIQIRESIIDKKNLAAEYNFIESILKKNSGFREIYLAPFSESYGDYQTIVMMLLIHNSGLSKDFTISSPSGCWEDPGRDPKYKCKKKAFSNLNDYEIVIIEDEKLPGFNRADFKIYTHQSPYLTAGLITPNKLEIAIRQK